ncbi:MAG: hypothetical protein MRY64_03780, partial [Hyphomonadaceae bacterium]|nr:hypothetical protein [Hyphomonadaceae bacterium]
CEASIANRLIFSGSIHDKMISQIEACEVFLADITIHNANVFWELGLRHVLKPNRYVIVGAQGQDSPFNIGNLNRVDYDYATPEERAASAEKIQKFIEDAVNEPNSTKTSPVYVAFPDLKVVRAPAKPFPTYKAAQFDIAGADGSQIGYSLGDITNIPDAAHPEHFDAIVVSENNLMKPPVIYERSLAARVHGFGAKRKGNRMIEEIRKDLKRQAGEGGDHQYGDAFITTSGEWRRLRGVQKVVHVAAVSARPDGFEGTPERSKRATRGALNKIDMHNKTKRSPKLRSAIFPIFGAGQGGATVEQVMPHIVEAVVEHMTGPRHSQDLKRVSLMCFDDRTLEAFDLAVRRFEVIEYSDSDIANTANLIEENKKPSD